MERIYSGLEIKWRWGGPRSLISYRRPLRTVPLPRVELPELLPRVELPELLPAEPARWLRLLVGAELAVREPRLLVGVCVAEVAGCEVLVRWFMAGELRFPLLSW